MSDKTVQLAENTTLVARTKELLKNRPTWMSYTRISKDTGLNVAWINSFANQDRDSGATKVITLYEYLTQKKLQIT